jgi:hypothetical protein
MISDPIARSDELASFVAHSPTTFRARTDALYRGEPCYLFTKNGPHTPVVGTMREWSPTLDSEWYAILILRPDVANGAALAAMLRPAFRRLPLFGEMPAREFGELVVTFKSY